MMRFYPASACHQLDQLKKYLLRQLPWFHRTNVCESSSEKFVVNRAHNSSTLNLDCLTLSSKTA